jgi:hypothetical protein
MPALMKTAAAIAALIGSTGSLLAAPICATQDDMAAFRTAAVQQQLMVAALTCKDTEDYNRFVIAYRPELQKSDAALKAFFIRQGNVAEYDTFKTKLANLSSLSTIANGAAYCRNANAAFDMALNSRQSLASFVADQRLMIALPQRSQCDGRPTMAMAMTAPGPDAAPPVRVAKAQSAAIAGVPAHDLPATPYGAAPPPRQDYDAQAYAENYDRQIAEDRARDQAGETAFNDAEDLPVPPRRPRGRSYSRGGQYSYGDAFDRGAPQAYPPRGYYRRW